MEDISAEETKEKINSSKFQIEDQTIILSTVLINQCDLSSHAKPCFSENSSFQIIKKSYKKNFE